MYCMELFWTLFTRTGGGGDSCINSTQIDKYILSHFLVYKVSDVHYTAFSLDAKWIEEKHFAGRTVSHSSPAVNVWLTFAHASSPRVPPAMVVQDITSLHINAHL